MADPPPTDNTPFNNYIVQTLYFYSKNANQDNNMYIDKLYQLFSQSVEKHLLNPTLINVNKNAFTILQEYFSKNDGTNNFEIKMVFLLNQFHTCVQRTIKTVLAPIYLSKQHTTRHTIEQIEQKYINIVNRLNTSNQYVDNVDILNEYFFYSPNNLFLGLKLLINPAHQIPPLQQTDVIKIINQTYDYVILLFTICLGINIGISNNKITTKPPELSQSNHMIISFLNIFVAYFTPLLNEIQITPPTLEYTLIIDHINWIIGLHNGAHEYGNTYETNKNTTYQKNTDKNISKSLDQNISAGISKNHDQSYDLLEAYNTEIIKQHRANQPVDYSAIFDAINTNIPHTNLIPTLGHDVEKIYMPEIPKDAAYYSILSKKHGLSQPEIERVLRKMDLNMCRQQLELTNTKSQFKITGITYKGNLNFIHNYLWYLDTQGTEIYDTNLEGFSILMYFQHIYTYFNENIENFNILTAINRHTDIIFLSKVGSFGFHTNNIDIQKILDSCDKPYGILLGAIAIDKKKSNLTSINAAHRVMLIVDYKDYPVPTYPANNFHKIYYFEPFGNFYPVFDVYGRPIPHIQEMVISQELANILGTDKKKYQIVLPLVRPKTPAYNSLFNLSRINYLGESATGYELLDTIINSTFHTNDKKTLDWMSGYCGLLVLFMTLLIKLNCIMPQTDNRLNIDDIFLWFNHFNSDPMLTYDNLLSRFILRGFAKVVEDILSGKQTQIDTIEFNLETLKEQFRTTVDNKQILPELRTQDNILQRKALKVLGLQPNPAPGSVIQVDMEKKMNALAFFMFWVANDEHLGDKKIKKDDGNENIVYDENLYDKLRNIFSKQKNRTSKKPINHVHLGTKINVLRTAIGNKLRTQKVIRYKGENREKLFNINRAAGGHQFNPNFGKIIFMDTTIQYSVPVAAGDAAVP